MGRGFARRLGAAGAALALASACGGGDEPPASGPAMRAEATGRAGNRAPSIASLRLDPADPVGGGRVRALATVRDPDGDRVELRYRWWAGGRALPDGGDALTLPALRRGDAVEVRLVASDGRLESEEARAEARVANRRPELRNVAIFPLRQVTRGDPVAATPDASDPDGDPLDFDYTWLVNGRALGEGGRELATRDLEPGDRIQARVRARDAESHSDPIETAIVTVVRGNAAPVILSSPAAVGAGEDFVYRVEADDPDGDRNLRYRLHRGPDGMEIDEVLGELRWPASGREPGVHEVEILVEDSGGAASIQSFELTVSTPEAASEAPAAPTP